MHKANHFALEDEAQRDVSHKNITKESPLLINPSTEDPALFIEFHQHIIAAKIIEGEESNRGRHTIDILKLNHRPDLVESRREKYEDYKKYLAMRIIAQRLIQNGLEVDAGRALLDLANQAIQNLKSIDSEFSAMFL